MLQTINRLFVVVILLAGMLMAAGCGSGDTGGDIEPISSIEAQSAPDPEMTNQPGPTSTPLPPVTPTDLPTEITEPVSPVQPVSPLKEPAMAIQGEDQRLPGSEAALKAAVADLSDRAGLAPDEISLVSMEAVEWNDASLGCPQEGYMYAQVITPGFLIVFQAQGQSYEYHTDQAGNVVLCDQ